jgi:hypothetical protein
MNPELEAFLAANPENAAIVREECIKAGDFVISDANAKIVGVQPTMERAARLIQHHLPDGDYSIEGPGTDLLLYRKDGTLYPSGGTLREANLPPRNLDECRDVFGE